ncbi:prolipoprotein diacylglyceryl transferase family protein [Hymenobacter caeli]|uniref:Phosphatidylglycerol:prolipoprotein diacylglycerol transferase n=1 Tax=Hymenobacter caeli TaxID=2735894 RepID=A0ABX2FLY7_9BACT|nr:prolipoprotein diacylglyceryl transferase family protein [Hymenobacter caeli]NRT17586.1 phosphatidylglycerol:prolipoprotein diacylglycerol transferase [Hymenobacter caeli]
MPAFTFELPAVFRPGHYTACYLLAVATYQALLLLEGRRRGFALRPWLLMQAVTLLAFVVGCKLVVLPLADWPALWRGGAALGAYPVRSALGGIAASSLTLWALRRWLGLGWAAFDAFVGPLAAGLAVQCLGCLAAGCCWGERAGGGGLGISFGPGTAPYAAQVARGLLPAGAPHALPVVPTQLYALLVCLALAGATWATRRRPWPAGTRYLLGTGALLLAWGALCQWRDPASQTLGAQPLVLAGVRLLALQWGVLAAGLLHLAGAALLCWWGTVFPVARAAAPDAPQPARQLAGAAALLVLTAALAPHALTGAEFRVLQAALGALLLAEAAAGWPALAAAGWRGQPRLAFAGALALLVLMSQAPAPRQDSARFIDFSVGASQGTFDQDFDYPSYPSGGGCGGGGGGSSTAQRTGYLHSYRAVGGQVAVQLRPGGRGFVSTAGLGAWTGTDHVGAAPQTPGDGPLQTSFVPYTHDYNLFDINPYVEGSTEPRARIGFGYHLGFHAGNLLNNQARRGDSVLTVQRALPDVQVWIGNRQRLFVQADAGYGAGGVGNLLYRVGLGTGLGASRASTVVAGLAFTDATSNTFAGLYSPNDERPVNSTLGFAAANIRLANSSFILEPTAATDFGRHHQISLRLHYRLGLKK